jgi:hypothetical protein
MRYFKDALIAAFPSNSKTVPPALKYGLEIVDILKATKAENLTSKTSKSSLAGAPQEFFGNLKAVEAARISEVIPYFNDALKPNAMAIERMNRFMTDGAPHFAHSAETSRAAD